MGRNLRLGLSWISSASDREAAYHRAVDQVWYAAGRERAAAASLGEIAAGASVHASGLRQSVSQREAQALREIDSHYRLVTGRAPPESRSRTETERELTSLRPSIAAGPREFLTGRSAIGSVPGLHGLMGFELLNFIDGSRSGLDVYRLLAAEAREAGEHYFGVVTPEAVLQYLKNAEGAKLVRL